ncbi:hypothetical protein V8C35DRAFT_327038 [Trichoderma chlorosporum]
MSSSVPRGRGRPPGSVNKRKGELSDNPHTKRARAWIQSKTVEEQHVYRAKSSLNQAIRRSHTKLRQQDDWINGDDKTKKRLEEEATELCHQKALLKDRHPDQLARNLSHVAAEKDAFGLTQDDGDESWETVDADEDGFTEQDRARQETYDAIYNHEPLNFGRIVSMDEMEFDYQTNQHMALMQHAFKELRRIPIELIEGLSYKLYRYNQNPSAYTMHVLESLNATELKDSKAVSITAFDVFTPTEISVWKQLGVAIKVPKLSPLGAAKRTMRCKTICRGQNHGRVFNHGGKRRPIYKWQPTLASMIRHIRHLSPEATVHEAASPWETLPGPSILWNLDNTEMERLENIFKECEDDTKQNAAKIVKSWILGRVVKRPKNFAGESSDKDYYDDGDVDIMDTDDPQEADDEPR